MCPDSSLSLTCRWLPSCHVFTLPLRPCTHTWCFCAQISPCLNRVPLLMASSSPCPPPLSSSNRIYPWPVINLSFKLYLKKLPPGLCLMTVPPSSLSQPILGVSAILGPPPTHFILGSSRHTFFLLLFTGLLLTELQVNYWFSTDAMSHVSWYTPGTSTGYHQTAWNLGAGRRGCLACTVRVQCLSIKERTNLKLWTVSVKLPHVP